MKKPNINDFETFFFDLDGTIYYEGKLIKGADTLIKKLQHLGKNVYVITNNCVRSREHYQKKLAEIGIPMGIDQVINATKMTVDWINKSIYKKAAIFVHGSNEMIIEMKAAGLNITSDFNNVKLVVVGNKMDTTWSELTNTAIGVQKGAEFIVVASDLKLILAKGIFGVDTGSIGELIADVADKKPIAILGKEHPGLIDKYVKGKTIIFGDRIYTDMKCAHIAKIKNCLVLSGASKLKDYLDNKKDINYCIESLNSMIK